MKKAILILAILLLPVLCFAGTNVSFRWDANSEPDLAGYKLYRGMSSGGPYYHVKDISPSLTEITDMDVPDGEWFWVLTAYDTEGLESGYSDEQTTILDSTPPDPPQNLTIFEKIIAWLESGSEKIMGWLKKYLPLG